MKLHLTLLLILCPLMALYSQSSTGKKEEKPVLPPGPLLNRAPEMATWLVIFKASGLVVEKPRADGSKPATDAGDSQTYVIKTKKIYHIEIKTGGKSSMDKWCLEGLQVTTVPHAEQPIVSMPGDEEFYLDLTETDFPGFEWISADNFQGFEENSGVKCMVFKDEIVGSSGLKMLVRAYVSLTSRLPVSLQMGDSLTLFEFKQAPATMLTPPQGITQLLEQRRERVRRASLVPPS